MDKRFGSLALTTTLAGLTALIMVACDKAPTTVESPPPSTTVGTPAGTTAGTTIDDTVITASVKSALLANPEIKSFDLQVETRKGEVQLSGFVDNQAQIDQASAIARDISGVTQVLNKVSIKGAPTTMGNTVDDSIVTTKVKAALVEDTTIKSLDISVVTRKGEVMLSGYVDNQLQLDRALAVARSVEGVVTVNNEMSLKK